MLEMVRASPQRGLTDSLMGLLNMSAGTLFADVVHTDILFTLRAIGLLYQVNALHLIVQQLPSLEFLVTIRAHVVAYIPMKVFHVVDKVLVLLVKFNKFNKFFCEPHWRLL